MTDLTVVERSRKGTGFDYWLGSGDELPFQKKARLEVSGIRTGEMSTIEARGRQKIRQVQRGNNALPVYIVIVEFGRPTAQVNIR